MWRLLLCLLLQGGEEGQAAVQKHLAAQEYLAAWGLMESMGSPVDRARARARILYVAGDPAGAWSAASAGLKEAPEQLELLYHAAGAALWLQDAEEAKVLTTRLDAAVKNSERSQSPGDHEAWLKVSADFLLRSNGLTRHDEELMTALSRARTLAIGALSLAALSALATLLYGRSRSPVS